MTSPILQMGKQRHGEGESLAPGPSASERGDGMLTLAPNHSTVHSGSIPCLVGRLCPPLSEVRGKKHEVNYGDLRGRKIKHMPEDSGVVTPPRKW